MRVWPMNRTRLKKREQQAAAVLKAITGIWESFDRVPSFRGKARLADKVKRAQTRAHNLHWDLGRDLSSE